MIEDPRGCIDYDERGNGPTIVLVPGSCSTGAAWRPIIAEWGGCFRCVTTSLLGYGGTAERRTADDVSIAHEAEILEAAIRQTRARVHVVGHSFGGTVALAVALRRQVPLASLTIIEAPMPELLREMGEDALYRQFRRMTHAYFTAFERGDKQAIASMIDFYGGEGTFAFWPQRARDYAVKTTSVNMLDWASAYGFQVSRADLSGVAVPALILRGGESHAAVKRVNELLSECIPGASLVTVAGAAHFMTLTHVREVASIVAGHLRNVDAIQRPLSA